jgi:hypothetical protein
VLGPLAGLPEAPGIEFDRGFLARVRLPVDEFLTHAAALDAAVPRIRVRVTELAADPTGFARCQHLGCVVGISGRTARVFVDRLGVWPTREDMEFVRGRLSRLEVLDLKECGVGDWFGDVFSWFDFPPLTELDLSNNQITDAGVSGLIECHLPKRLILAGNPITDRAATELAGWLATSPVQHLDLRGTLIGRAGTDALHAACTRDGKIVDLSYPH